MRPAAGQDLNANSVEDARDIRLGTSGDCNVNGFVDERDAAAPHLTQAIEHLNALEGEQFQNDVWSAQPIDFNQDGQPDLVVTSMYSTNTGAVSFWRNDGGAGLVHVSRRLIDGTRPYSLRVADFNGDGLQDFATSDANENRVFVFMATGPETFAEHITLDGPAANNGSVGLDVADLDGDGDIDIAFTCWYPAGVTTYLNDGQGAFQLGTNFSTGSEPRDLSIGDFTGDGVPDLATANEFYSTTPPGTVSLHRANGDGTFTLHATLTPPSGVPPYEYEPRPFYVELVDVDGDGDRDLVASSKGANNVTVYSNDGAGAFTLTQTLGGWWLESEMLDVLLRDLDGDGLPELIAGNTDMQHLAVHQNVAGTFELHQNFATANYGGYVVAAADFNGDDRLDLVTSNTALRSFCVLENTGGLNYDATIQLRVDEFPAQGQIADFTSDGLADTLFVRQPLSSGPSFFSVYSGLGGAEPGTGGAVFSKTPIDTILSVAPGFIVIRDVNADGKPDILDVTGHCLVYMGNGDGTFAPAISSPILPVGLRMVTGHINSDAHLDLAWVQSGHPSILKVSFGDGTGAFGASTDYTDVAENETVGIGDITGDGRPEIFTGHRSGVFSWHLNNGDGTFAPRQDYTITSAPLNPTINAIAVADFDMDGDNDVTVSAMGLKLFVNDGAGFLNVPPVQAAAASASMLEVADIDLDGTPDLYGRGSRGIVYLNTQGTGVFDITMFLRHYDSNARFMVVADANNDGRQDVMIRPENSWSHFLFLNLPAADTDSNANGVLDSCEQIVMGDISGDGVVDVNDLLAVINAWGPCGAVNCPADIAPPPTGDDMVNVDDLLLVINSWR